MRVFYRNIVKKYFVSEKKTIFALDSDKWKYDTVMCCYYNKNSN